MKKPINDGTIPWYESWNCWWASPELGFLLAVLACLVLNPTKWQICLVFWTLCEFGWRSFQKKVCLPRLVSHRPEDAFASPITEPDFDRAIDNVAFMLAADAPKFWSRVTGRTVGMVPRSTARGFMKSLLFMYEDKNNGAVVAAAAASSTSSKDKHGSNVPCQGRAAAATVATTAATAAASAMLERGLARLEVACGGYAEETEDITGAAAAAAAAKAVAGVTTPGKSGPQGGKGGAVSPPANTLPSECCLIQGWHDDVHLASLVRSTPLVVSLACLALNAAAALCLRACGWTRGPTNHAGANLECWIHHHRKRSNRNDENDDDDASSSPPLVLIPGAGSGLVSFLPFALSLQWGHVGSSRDLVLFRLPHVEIGRPWTHFPQWSQVVEGVLGSLELLRVKDCDIIAHSYGTAVANRVMRKLCGQSNCSCNGGENGGGSIPAPAPPPPVSSASSFKTGMAAQASSPSPSPSSPASLVAVVPPPSSPRLVVGFLGLVDPIVLGGASCGLVGVINQHGPDLSFAFAANRAGVTNLEVFDYDPTSFGQCCGHNHKGGNGGGEGGEGSEEAVRGVGVYLSEGDVLVDPALAKHILNKHLPPAAVTCVVDDAPLSPHGRWLVEMWAGGGGILWHSPCATRCLALLMGGIHNGNNKKAAASEGGL